MGREIDGRPPPERRRRAEPGGSGGRVGRPPARQAADAHDEVRRPEAGEGGLLPGLRRGRRPARRARARRSSRLRRHLAPPAPRTAAPRPTPAGARPPAGRRRAAPPPRAARARPRARARPAPRAARPSRASSWPRISRSIAAWRIASRVRSRCAASVDARPARTSANTARSIARMTPDVGRAARRFVPNSKRI